MLSKPKIAIVHAFFKADCKGGGEKLILQIREKYSADLYVGGYDDLSWGKHLRAKDYYANKTWDPRFGFEYFHIDSKIPVWRQLKRQFYFLFSSKIKKLTGYDLVIFSGNIGFLQRRLKHLINKAKTKTKLVTYVHTPPRPFTDQFETRLKKIPVILHPLVKFFRSWLITEYKKDLQVMDLIIANSENIKKRLAKFTKVEANTVIFPLVETDKFKYLGQENYYFSYGRLELLKRIPLILEAFRDMPNKKLIIASGGPLADYVKDFIKKNQLKNIIYEGLVTQTRLRELVGKCIAGVYIPVDEDAGMTQVEIMSAGKPVIGVAEGGLLETIINDKTGILISKNPSKEDLIKAVTKMTKKKAKEMQKACQEQAQNYSPKKFYIKMDKALNTILKT